MARLIRKRRQFEDLFSEEELERDEVDRLIADLPIENKSRPNPSTRFVDRPVSLLAVLQAVRTLLERELYLPTWRVGEILPELEELLVLSSDVEAGEAQLRKLGSKRKGKYARKNRTGKVHSRDTLGLPNLQTCDAPKETSASCLVRRGSRNFGRLFTRTSQT